MPFEILLAPEAVEDLRRLKVRDAPEIHLRHEPTRTGRSRIRRLRGLRRPQYRLRVGEVRVFYDDPRFIARIERARASLAQPAGSGWKTWTMSRAAIRSDAARIVERVAARDVVGQANHVGKREVIVGTMRSRLVGWVERQRNPSLPPEYT